MSEDSKIKEEEVSIVIKAAVTTIVDVIARLIEADIHTWSTRPCATCRVISAALGKPFGCDKYRIEHPNT